MNILLVNHYAGSRKYGMEYRPYYLAREWVRMGHSVTILASAFSHVRSENPKMTRFVRREVIDGIQYIWLKTPGYQGNGFRRALNIFSFVGAFAVLQKTLFRDTSFDLIIASSTYPLDFFPVWLLAKSKRANAIYEVHDLWPLSLIELGNMSPRHPFILLLQYAENFAYRHADYVVSLLPKALEHMREHGLADAKFVYIPNGIPVEDWAKAGSEMPDEHAALLNSLKANNQFIIGYAGAHGIANGLDALIEAAAMVRGEDVSFVLVGDGAQKEMLVRKASEIGLDNLVFLPPVPRDAVPGLLDAMDGLFISLKPKALFRFGVSPNKLMDYMMAAKPVIYAVEAGNDPVAESGCGISIHPDDPKAIADAALKLKQMPKDVRRRMGAKGKNYVVARHDYRQLARKFLDAVV